MKMGRGLGRFAAVNMGLGLCFLLAACSHLPANGPDSEDVEEQAATSLEAGTDKPALGYALVDITPKVIERVPEIGPGLFYKTFGVRRGSVPELRVKVGDTLVVSIYEASAGTLFAPVDPARRGNNYVALPPQAVDQAGRISVPFAGEVPVVGLTLQEIRREIESRLAKRALEPQAIVTLPDLGTGSVTVIGDATTAANMRLRASGDRILEVIARSGGSRVPEHETVVSLQRGGHQATIYYPTLLSSPRENVYVQPGDIVTVSRYQRKFAAFGALSSGAVTSGLTGQFPFESERMSLQEALSRTGGLSDSRADAVEVYLYRVEERETLDAMGAKLKAFKKEQRLIPTIYRLNLRDPSGFFLAQRFQMRDKDIIYVANARSVEVTKFFDYIGAITGGVAGIAGDVLDTRNSIRALLH